MSAKTAAAERQLAAPYQPGDRIATRGGAPLKGTIRVSGAKNAALPIMAAALLTDEPCTLDNVPTLQDIAVMSELLQTLGADVQYQPEKHRVRIHAREITRHSAPQEL